MPPPRFTSHLPPSCSPSNVNEGALAANGARGLANFVVGSSVVALVQCDKMNRKNTITKTKYTKYLNKENALSEEREIGGWWCDVERGQQQPKRATHAKSCDKE